MLKKSLKRGLIIALIIVAVAFIPGLGGYLLKWIAPPRLFYVIGGLIVIILSMILTELRKRNGGDKE